MPIYDCGYEFCTECTREFRTKGADKMGKTVTESIYDGIGVIVPLADVQHIEREKLGIIVVTKHTRRDCDKDIWANPIFIEHKESQQFLKCWCAYRRELERDVTVDLSDHTALELL